jgi:hypothetical protein
VPAGAIEHVLLIDLENESFTTTFGPTSPATFLNSVLLKQGELVDNYFATGHASLDNYISQISAQSPNGTTKADCSNLASLSPPFTGIKFGFVDVAPGTDDSFPATNPGQVDGQGCVFPAPNPATAAHGAPTITDQIDSPPCWNSRGDQKGRPTLSFTEDVLQIRVLAEQSYQGMLVANHPGRTIVEIVDKLLAERERELRELESR